MNRHYFDCDHVNIGNGFTVDTRRSLIVRLRDDMWNFFPVKAEQSGRKLINFIRIETADDFSDGRVALCPAKMVFRKPNGTIHYRYVWDDIFVQIHDRPMHISMKYRFFPDAVFT